MDGALFSSTDHGRDNDPSWAAFWANQRGFKLDLRLNGAQHSTFSDGETLWPQVAPVIGLSASALAQLVGTIDPDRAISVERTYLPAYFDQELRHRGSRLLEGPSPRYPEVQFVS